MIPSGKGARKGNAVEVREGAAGGGERGVAEGDAWREEVRGG